MINKILGYKFSVPYFGFNVNANFRGGVFYFTPFIRHPPPSHPGGFAAGVRGGMEVLIFGLNKLKFYSDLRRSGDSYHPDKLIINSTPYNIVFTKQSGE